MKNRGSLAGCVCLALVSVGSASFGQSLYTEGPGVNPPFASIRNNIDNGFSGTDINVNNSLVEGGLYGDFGVQSPLRLHTLARPSVTESNFGAWSRWYQTDGDTQVFRLFPGEENVSNDRDLAARVEAFDHLNQWNVAGGEWHDWVGRYTIVKPISAAIFQAKDDDDEDWSLQLNVTSTGRVLVQHRRPLPGQPKTETLIENAIGQPFDVRVRDNGLDYEVYLGSQTTPFTSGRYVRNSTPGDNSFTRFRWGMYVGASEVTSEGLIFVSHASVDPILTPPTPYVPDNPIVGWHTWTSSGEAAQFTDFGASGSASEASGDWREANEAASNDGTFGTVTGASTTVGAASSGTYIGQTGGSGGYDFTVTAGADGLVLTGFHFDVLKKRSGSPDGWSVSSVAGAITTGVTLGSGTLNRVLSGLGPSDHDDVEVALAALTDNVLEPGESATFRLSFTGGTVENTDQRTYLDNVAILGVAVPTLSAPGDFNGDGLVDAADYTVWRDNRGANDSALAAGSADGSSSVVDAGDFNLWKNNYGATRAATASARAASVPEPCALMLAGLAVVRVVGRSNRRRGRRV